MAWDGHFQRPWALWGQAGLYWEPVCQGEPTQRPPSRALPGNVTVTHGLGHMPYNEAPGKFLPLKLSQR